MEKAKPQNTQIIQDSLGNLKQGIMTLITLGPTKTHQTLTGLAILVFLTTHECSQLPGKFRDLCIDQIRTDGRQGNLCGAGPVGLIYQEQESTASLLFRLAGLAKFNDKHRQTHKSTFSCIIGTC